MIKNEVFVCGRRRALGSHGLLGMDAARVFYLVMLAITLFFLLIPVISSFPLGPLHGAAPSGFFFSSQLSFPGVALREGIRRIHTLEHLENITSPAKFFYIQHVSQPRRYGDHVTTCVQCSIEGVSHAVYMIGRPHAPQTCTIMCVRDGTQRAVVTLRATQFAYEESGVGHRVTVGCTLFRGTRVYDRGMEPIMRFLRSFERRQASARSVATCGERANLQWYRRMVLGLDGADSTGLE